VPLIEEAHDGGHLFNPLAITLKRKRGEHKHGSIAMVEAFCQDLIRVQSIDSVPRQGTWKGSIEKENLIRSQSTLNAQLPAFYVALQGGPIGENGVDRSSFSYLPLNDLSRSLRNRLEPLIGQLIDQGCLTAAGRSGDHMPIRLDRERH
jgi:hypothetical protein